MANIVEVESFDSGVYLIDEDDDVLGGDTGPANMAPKNLANRTKYLYARMLESVRLSAINAVTGAYTIATSDIGKLITIHNPAATSLTLPALAGFPKNNPFTVLVTETGSTDVVLTANGSEVVEDWLNSGSGVTAYHLKPGTRAVIIATTTSWVVVLKSTPQVPVAGYLPGNALFDFGVVAAKTGFLLCDGAAYNRTDYPALFAAIGLTWSASDDGTTFNVPDGRDYFPRVFNGGNAVDVGRAMGTYQDDQFQGHTFGISDGSKLDRSATGNGSVSDAATGTTKTEYKTSGVSLERAEIVADDIGNGAPRIGKETRARNFTINMYIKF